MNKLKINKIKYFFIIFTLVIAIIGYCSINTKPPELFGEQPKWAYHASGKIISCLPENESRIFVQANNGLISLDTTTGKTIWATNLKKDAQRNRINIFKIGMKLSDEALIFPRDNGNIMIFSAENGQLFHATDWISYLTLYDMAIDKKNIYAAYLSSSLVAIDIKSGKEIWRNIVPNKDSLYIFPMNDSVYLVTSDNVFQYDAATGKLISEHTFSSMIKNVVVESGVAYVAFFDGAHSFAALDLATFKYLWYVSTVEVAPPSRITKSIVDNGNVYFSGSRFLALSEKNGVLSWESDADDVFGAPIISGNYLIAQGKSRLYIFDKNTGEEIDRVDLPGPFPLLSWMFYQQANPCANDKNIWLAEGEWLYAYNMK